MHWPKTLKINSSLPKLFYLWQTHPRRGMSTRNGPFAGRVVTTTRGVNPRQNLGREGVFTRCHLGISCVQIVTNNDPHAAKSILQMSRVCPK